MPVRKNNSDEIVTKGALRVMSFKAWFYGIIFVLGLVIGLIAALRGN